jgi:hypothetical protein
MFITLQFPLFDRRYFEVNDNRDNKPDWSDPQQRDSVRYFGEIISRNKNYSGPLDGEKNYCVADKVINLCGTANEHFYKSMHQSAFASRIIFRRFRSDGRCLSKFEIAFNDDFESTVDDASLQKTNLSDLVFAHIQKYLLCPVKIKIGNKLSNYIPLIDAGRYLKTALYWATVKGRRSFNQKEMQDFVEHCEPLALVQVNSSRISFNKDELKNIPLPELAKENIQLYNRFVPYKLGKYNFNLKGWFICVPKNIYTNPVHKNEFNFYNETIRYLRINLLHIHAETVIRQKFFSLLGSIQDKHDLNDQQLIIRLYKSLHKVLLNLSNITRNKLPQEMLVKTAFELDETYDDAESMEEVISGAKGFMAWLKEHPLTKQTQQIIDSLDQLLIDFANKNAAEMIDRTVFISYNHNDEATALALKARLENAQLNVILDSASMKAGTEIKNFISKSIQNSKATISVVSNNSLLSGWVGIETVNALNFKDFFPEKEFIACCLDEDFIKDNYVKDASAKFQKRLDEIAAEINRRNNENDSRDLNEEKSRLIMLDKSLDGIIGKLKSMLRIDIAGNNLEKNFEKILDAIKNN